MPNDLLRETRDVTYSPSHTSPLCGTMSDMISSPSTVTHLPT